MDWKCKTHGNIANMLGIILICYATVAAPEAKYEKVENKLRKPTNFHSYICMKMLDFCEFMVNKELDWFLQKALDFPFLGFGGAYLHRVWT